MHWFNIGVSFRKLSKGGGGGGGGATGRIWILRRGGGGMLPQIFFFLVDALRLILRHSGGTSSQF